MIASSLKHIQDPIDALRRPLRGGSLKGGRTDDRRTRRSKTGDHGLANPAFGETMESRILDGDEGKTLAATTYQLAARAKIMGKSLITVGGLWLGGRRFPSCEGILKSNAFSKVTTSSQEKAWKRQ